MNRRTLPGRVTALVAVAATLATIGAGATAAPAAPAGKPVPGHATSNPAFVSAEKAAARNTSTPASRAALTQVQKQVRSYVASHGTTYTFGTYADLKTGAVVVETNAPAAVTRLLTNVTGMGVGTRVSVRTSAATRDLYSRRNDIAPFWGGNGLLAGGALCSAGYTVQNASGYPYLVTAGHCFGNGTVVRTESNTTDEGYVAGQLLASLGGGPRDMEVLYNQSYAGRIYTGGVDSITSAPGSPFYAKDGNGNAYIRGHVIAGNGTTSYAEKWDKVASAYGVSIVTG